jgi:predicted enzyme related to lactoylglutathione lyase
MVEKTKYDSGTFCWVELAAKDGAAAKRFYTSLFGWEVDDIPVPDGTPMLTDPESSGFAVIRLNMPAQ